MVSEALRTTVLVIEDHYPNYLVLKGHLQGAGYRVLGAATGEAGVALARAGGVDLITLDLQMEPLDGWEVLKLLRAEASTREIPVLLVTIVDQQVIKLELPAVGYVAKPFRGKKLLGAVELALSSGGQRAEHAVALG